VKRKGILEFIASLNYIKNIKSFSYPYGDYNNKIRKLVKKAGLCLLTTRKYNWNWAIKNIKEFYLYET